ncbi:MAG: ferrous iron transport protein A [Anaerolineales bacterium]|nr:ferrous iron transport protein A [Anaerolineales bacterium]
MIPLSELKPGQQGTITRIEGNGALRRRCLEMGLVRGETILAERVAPLGDPRAFLIKGYRLALRREEAELIHVADVRTQPGSEGPSA